jgi:hypothetical protein
MVSAMGQIVVSEVGNAGDLVELAGLVHCAALATCKALVCKFRPYEISIFFKNISSSMVPNSLGGSTVQKVN